MGHQVIYGCYDKQGCTDSAFIENLNSPDKDNVTSTHFKNFALNTSSKDECNVFENKNYILSYIGNICSNEGTSFNKLNADRLIELVYSDPNSLRGGFAIICFNKFSGELLLLRDHLGIIPLYYFEDTDAYYFSTDIKYLLSVFGSDFTVDEQWIADSISTIKSEKWRTFYKGIRKVLPGHEYRVLGQQCIQDKYWTIESIGERDDLIYSDAVSIYKELLIKAVQRGLDNNLQIGTELSGGLDSSGVTAVANELASASKLNMPVFTHAFSESSSGKYFPYKDETMYSNAFCKELKIPEHILCDADGKGIIQAMKSSIKNLSGPSQQAYSLFSDLIYESAKTLGIEKLFSGFGGDEGVSSHAKAYLLELEEKRNWSRYREVLFSSGNKGTYLYKVFKYFIVRFFPLLKKFARNKFSQNSCILTKFSLMAVDHNFDNQLQIKERYRSEYSLQDYKYLRDVQLKKIMHNHISQRFEYSYHNAGSYGIEYAYPLWDIDLLEFYFSLPAEFKYRDGKGRAIFRDAMKDILPDEIRLRMDKTGATIPTIHQRFLFDYDEIIKIIKEAKSLNNYHYLDYDKMLAWSERLKNWGKGKDPILPGPYFNSLQILLLQQMERSGEFKSGIRC